MLSSDIFEFTLKMKLQNISFSHIEFLNSKKLYQRNPVYMKTIRVHFSLIVNNLIFLHRVYDISFYMSYDSLSVTNVKCFGFGILKYFDILTNYYLITKS